MRIVRAMEASAVALVLVLAGLAAGLLLATPPEHVSNLGAPCRHIGDPVSVLPVCDSYGYREARP